MKKVLLLAACFLMTLAACQKTELAGPADGGLQSITVSVPQSVSTKASGDGSQVNRCILEVYRGGTLYGERLFSSVSGGKATFDLRLVSNQTYDFVFWADKAEGDAATGFTDLYYATDNLSAIKVKKAYVANDEGFDAFTYCEKGFKVTKAFSLSVTLKRPFGQLNVSTLDLGEIKDESLKPTDVKVSFKSVPTAFNALTGEAGKEAPLEYTASVSDAASGLLTVDYILASEAENATLADFSMTFLNNNTEICTNDAFTNIPLRRNYRTNVSGNLLTKKGTISVTVNPEFETPDIEHKVEKVTSIDDISAALESGASNIVVTEAPTAPADIAIPNLPEGMEEISISLPHTDFPVTFCYAEGATETPEKVTVEIPDSKDLIINLPNSIVTLVGENYNNVTATTAANTLIIAEDVTVANLTIKGGNVQVYGKIGKIVSKPAGTIVSLRVKTPERLAEYAANETAMFNKVVIENDIDFKGEPFKIAKVSNVEIDGQGHRISNFKVENEQKAGFVCDATSVIFRNLTIENANVTAQNDGSGNAYAGTFIGRSYGTVVFDNCVALNSSVEGVNKVGGLIGFVAENHVEATASKVIGCKVSNTDVPEESGQIGGFAGYLGNLYNSTCSFMNCSVENTTINAFMNRADRTVSKFIGCFQGSEATDILSIDNCSVKDVTLNGMNEMAQSFVSTYGDLLGGQRYGKGKVTIKNSDVTVYISSRAQLAQFAALVNAGNSFAHKTVKLTSDIDLENIEWIPIGKNKKSFEGIFDGCGYTISNLKIEKSVDNNSDNSDQGLFGYTSNGEIKNFTLHNAKVKGGLYVGVVSGTPYTSKYSDIRLTGLIQVEGYSYVGGMFGKNAYANLKNLIYNYLTICK